MNTDFFTFSLTFSEDRREKSITVKVQGQNYVKNLCKMDINRSCMMTMLRRQKDNICGAERCQYHTEE